MLTLSRRHLIGLLSGSLFVPEGAASAAQAVPQGLERGFAAPPDDAKPWVYWFWLNGHISREGITADLEAMKQNGIAGALIMSVEGGAQPGPVRFMTPEWRDLFRHVLAEADRLGLTIDMNNNDGWDCGGPWIKPHQAMQKMVWTEQRLSGPRKFSGALPQPAITRDFYRDVVVLAFPEPLDDAVKSASTSSNQTIEFAQSFMARAATITTKGRRLPLPVCELQVSDDGVNFRTVSRIETGWETVMAGYSAFTAAIPETRGRFYRMVGPNSNVRFNFELHGGARIHFWEMKAGFINLREHGGGAHLFLNRDLPPLTRGSAMPHDAVIDLSARMDASGRLDWDVPAGNWTVLRIGHTPTGKVNFAATPEGRGLDCDALSRAGIEAHFPGMMGKLLDDRKPSLKYCHNDSWESGCQNWTAEFREEFRKRRGYDLLAYLPVMAGGRVVDGTDVSERFLWDVRRTISDLMAEYYWGHLGALCHAHGLQYTVESAGRQQFLYDPINLLSKGDLPMGEFWANEQWARPDCKLAASVAHAYGKPVVGAEAYTSNSGPSAQWQVHPFSLKAKGDHAFCTGINRFVFHRYLHQRYLDRRPGVDLAGVGMNFERTQTWWRQSAAWMSYLARCQYLLQRGVFVGDLCYFTGEDVPNALVRRSGKEGALPAEMDASTFTEITLGRSGALPPAPPPGYDFDGCNLELLMRLSVWDGRLVLPSGMTYRVLVLPPAKAMTPAVARRVRDLVQMGATVVGPKPAHSPSLADYPNCDGVVRRLADQVWENCDGQTVLEHSLGKGKVIWGKPLSEVLAALGALPDFSYAGHNKDAELDYIHRRDGEAEIYFVSNQKDRFEEVECGFRVNGKTPELWHPDTGRIERPAVFVQKNGRTTLPLRLDPCGSVFVIFREPAKTESIVSALRSGEPVHVDLCFTAAGRIELKAWEAGPYEFNTPSGKALKAKVAGCSVQAVTGPWELRFPPGQGAPEKIVLERLVSWTQHPEDGVKYFSGTATYVKDLDIPAGELLCLDLGQVKEIAEVRVNGKDLGVLWKPPFRLDLSGLVRPGRNRIEIRVTNLWPNRMIGDLGLPEGKRYTWSTWNPYTKDSPLPESGLLGPVVLMTGRRVLL